MALKLLIADDERLFRQSLRKLLESVKDIKVVAEAADGQEAVLRTQDKEPDIALLDVRMPKMRTKKILSRSSATPTAVRLTLLLTWRT
jgi:YesN/AraC family two-component response regulator